MISTFDRELQNPEMRALYRETIKGALGDHDMNMDGKELAIVKAALAGYVRFTLNGAAQFDKVHKLEDIEALWGRLDECIQTLYRHREEC